MSRSVKGASATYFGLFLLQLLLRYIFSQTAGGHGRDVFENRPRESWVGDPFNLGLVEYTWCTLLNSTVQLLLLPSQRNGPLCCSPGGEMQRILGPKYVGGGEEHCQQGLEPGASL